MEQKTAEEKDELRKGSHGRDEETLKKSSLCLFIATGHIFHLLMT